MVNDITARTIYCIISLAAVVLPLMACAAPEPAIQEIGTTREPPTTVNVTPTAPPQTPAPKATSTPEPASGTTPNPSSWTFFEGPPHPISGAKSHGLRVTGTVISPADYANLFRDPWLYLRCDADLFETYVTWGSRPIAGNLRTETIATVYHVDDETPVNTTSSESENNEASFFMDPTRFVRDLMDTERVVIRVTNYDDTEMTAVFPTDGLGADVAKLSCRR